MIVKLLPELMIIKCRSLLPFFLGIGILLFQYSALAQNIPVGASAFEDYTRRMQLTGSLDSTISFTVRPVLSIPLAIEDENFTSIVGISRTSTSLVTLLPFSWQQQYITHHPYNWNDGLMIPAKGYQTLASGGIYAKVAFISIQLRPEILFAENAEFKQYVSHSGQVDLPERFGNKPYTKFSWGQSNIRVTAGPVSLGLSNENLWWGPGMRNSLLMSNNAPGFKHLTLNTTKPIAIGIGNIEGQIVGGRLEESQYTTAGTPDDWRYLSAMVVTYHPKWFPGLFLGLTRSFQQYGKDERKFSDYFPLFQAFQKKNTNEDSVERDQLTSLFLRWMMTKSKAEVYFEYGLNDHSYNLRDFLMSPEHSRAYTIGFRKLVPLTKRDWNYMSIAFELTHMEQSIDRIVREAGEWYTHSQIIHGYTNQGQVLGAGIGPGGNFQSLDISWYKGLKRLGLQIERFEHNGDLANGLERGQWIDCGVGAVTDVPYKRILISGKLQGIQSYNYQWNTGINGTPNENVFNLKMQLGIMYKF